MEALSTSRVFVSAAKQRGAASPCLLLTLSIVPTDARTAAIEIEHLFGLPTKEAHMKKLSVLVIVSLVAAASAQAAGAGVRKHGLQLAQKKAAGRQSSV